MLRDLDSYVLKVNRLMREKELAQAAVIAEKKQLQNIKAQVKATQEAQQCIQIVAKELQQKSHAQIAKVVSRCLKAVFDEPYELRIEFDKKRGKTDASFFLARGGHIVAPRVTSGAVREVVSIALRLACICLSRPRARRLLILDEPFSGLSGGNKEKISALIESLARELGVQFVIVTHDESLMVGKVIEI